jgi:hypothetical protein
MTNARTALVHLKGFPGPVLTDGPAGSLPSKRAAFCHQ